MRRSAVESCDDYPYLPYLTRAERNGCSVDGGKRNLLARRPGPSSPRPPTTPASVGAARPAGSQRSSGAHRVAISGRPGREQPAPVPVLDLGGLGAGHEVQQQRGEAVGVFQEREVSRLLQDLEAAAGR